MEQNQRRKKMMNFKIVIIAFILNAIFDIYLICDCNAAGLGLSKKEWSAQSKPYEVSYDDKGYVDSILIPETNEIHRVFDLLPSDKELITNQKTNAEAIILCYSQWLADRTGEGHFLIRAAPGKGGFIFIIYSL